MKVSKRVILIIASVLVLLIGGGVSYATNTPSARADRQLNLGNKYLQEGKYQEAILAFEKVIQIEPKNISARLGLGQAYIATKEFVKAETVLKEVIGIDPNNIQAREDLFKAYLTEGNLDEANAILEEISKIEPNKDISTMRDELKTNYAPRFVDGYPKVKNVTQTSFDLVVKFYDTASLDYLVLSHGSAAPTAEEISNGELYNNNHNNDNDQAIHGGVSWPLEKNQELTISITNAFYSNTEYDVYCVTKEWSDNTWKYLINPVKLQVTTSS